LPNSQNAQFLISAPTRKKQKEKKKGGPFTLLHDSTSFGIGCMDILFSNIGYYYFWPGLVIALFKNTLPKIKRERKNYGQQQNLAYGKNENSLFPKKRSVFCVRLCVSAFVCARPRARFLSSLPPVCKSFCWSFF